MVKDGDELLDGLDLLLRNEPLGLLEGFFLLGVGDGVAALLGNPAATGLVRAIIMASCRRLTCICQYESWSRSSESRILFNSRSTPPRAFRASSVKVTSATRKSFRDWIDRTFADSAMGYVPRSGSE